MFGRQHRRWSPMAGLTLGLVIGLAAEPVMAKTFKLSITGDEGAHYSGQCTLVRDAHEEIIDLEGDVPLQREFVADGVGCRLEAQGRLTVELRHDGSRSRAATTGGFVNIQAR